MAILDTNKYKLIYSDSIAKALIGLGGITETLNDYVQHTTIDGLADLVISNAIDISPLYPEIDIKTIEWDKANSDYQLRNHEGSAFEIVNKIQLIEQLETSTELRAELLRSYIQKLSA